MAIDLEVVTARQSRLESAVADLAELPWDELPADVLDSLLAAIESTHRRLPTICCEVITRLRDTAGLKRKKRLRDHLANLLHISATEAGTRIAMAGDLAGEQPALPETAAATRHGLIGAAHIRIIRDTIGKLPDSASDADRVRFDLELTGIAVAERPEVLRRNAALLLAEFDATRDDPVTRERSRAARRDFVLGPQDADGMSRGRFCLDPDARAYLEIILAKLARPGMCNASDAIPAVDDDPDPFAASGDTRTAIVTMTLQELESASGLALTGGGSTVPMEDAIRMAAHAHHYLYVYDGTTGRPLFLGRSKRLASADQRIVLHAIDRGCTVPGCDQPAYNCEVHHLIEWSPDGTTDIDRLTLTCQDGNLSAGPTDEEWQARRRYDEESLGQTLWYPPKSVDPSRQPRTNRFHRRPNRPHPEPDAA